MSYPFSAFTATPTELAREFLAVPKWKHSRKFFSEKVLRYLIRNHSEYQCFCIYDRFHFDEGIAQIGIFLKQNSCYLIYYYLVDDRFLVEKIEQESDVHVFNV